VAVRGETNMRTACKIREIRPSRQWRPPGACRPRSSGGAPTRETPFPLRRARPDRRWRLSRPGRSLTFVHSRRLDESVYEAISQSRPLLEASHRSAGEEEGGSYGSESMSCFGSERSACGPRGGGERIGGPYRVLGLEHLCRLVRRWFLGRHCAVDESWCAWRLLGGSRCISRRKSD
jgi:hypothetical protein